MSGFEAIGVALNVVGAFRNLRDKAKRVRRGIDEEQGSSTVTITPHKARSVPDPDWWKHFEPQLRDLVSRTPPSSPNEACPVVSVHRRDAAIEIRSSSAGYAKEIRRTLQRLDEKHGYDITVRDTPISVAKTPRHQNGIPLAGRGGRPAMEVNILEEMVNIERRTLQENDPALLASQHELAVSYYQSGRLADAIETLNHIISVHKKNGLRAIDATNLQLLQDDLIRARGTGNPDLAAELRERNQNHEDDEPSLCLLSLDGDGPRGQSTLFVLKVIMDHLNEKWEGSFHGVRPCHVFDLIGGTGIGGYVGIHSLSDTRETDCAGCSQ